MAVSKANDQLLHTHVHNSTVLQDLVPGDLVEFKRGYYSHWAVYKGDGDVIHLSGGENDGINAPSTTLDSCFTICGQSFNKAFVTVDNFFDVAANSKAYIRNDQDKKRTPRPADEIISEALEKIGEIGYNVLWCNCEHFAKFCRYGKPSSEQVDNVFTGVIVTGGMALLAAGLSYMFGSEKKKKSATSA